MLDLSPARPPTWNQIIGLACAGFVFLFAITALILSMTLLPHSTGINYCGQGTVLVQKAQDPDYGYQGSNSCEKR